MELSTLDAASQKRRNAASTRAVVLQKQKLRNAASVSVGIYISMELSTLPIGRSSCVSWFHALMVDAMVSCSSGVKAFLNVVSCR